jgi:hypothetical protein
MAASRFLLVLILFGFAFLLAPAAATAADVPRIRSVHRKTVLVEVPPGYRSVTLRERADRKGTAWRILATRRTKAEGGVFRILLKHPVARRDLAVVGLRSIPLNLPINGPITKFLADPALLGGRGYAGAIGNMPGVVALSRASADASAAPATREVVESDIWRIEGDRLYYFNQLRGLQVFDISDPDAPVLLGQLREPNRGEQMYLLDSDHVALLTRASSFFSLVKRPLPLSKDASDAYDPGSGAIVIAKVSAGKPDEVARLPYAGFLVESRLVGSTLYLVSQVYENTGENGLIVSSYDLSDPAAPRRGDTLALGGWGGVVSATDRFLFAVRSSEDWRRSVIEVIDISAPDGSMARSGQIRVAGRIPDKFKLNLDGDVLTVVSEVPRNWSGNWNAPQNQPRTMVETFSLAHAAPAKLGSLELGVGETLFASRFSGNRLYVVTFLVVDPLWVVDLSDPRNPTLLGELELPGFSTYIEPLGDRLLSIGRLDSQTAVTLFDVSDCSDPKVLSQLPLGDGSSYSEADWNEKAFGVFPDEGLILVPYSGYDRASGWASRIQLLDLGRDDLAKRGVVEQGFAARRTAVVGDRILAVSPSDLVTVDFADRDRPVVTSEVEIAWRVDRVFLSGEFVVEIGGSANWRRPAPPSITIATADDPDSTVRLLELEDEAPVTGATVRDGKLYLAQQDSGLWLPVYRLDGNAKDGTPPASNPLILSVFDLSALPEITRLGRTEAKVDPGYGYGAAQLEAAWPKDDTLVWVRQQWSSWWWYRPLPIGRIATTGTTAGASDGSTGISLPGSIALAPSGSVALANANLVTSGEPIDGSPSAAPSSPGEAVAASALALSDASARMIAPWHRSSVGQEMVAFDVGDPSSPRYASTVNARIGNTGDWSAPVALDGKLYLSAMAYDGFSTEGGRKLPRQHRHFLRTVDFSDADRPTLGNEVNIPGRLLAVAHGGETLLTVGRAFDAWGRPRSQRAFHTSRYDGATATLVSQLRHTSGHDAYALDGDTLLTATSSSQASQASQEAGIGSVRAWRIDDKQTLARAGSISAPNFWSIGSLNGLLVGFGAGLPQVYDVSDPERLRHLERVDTRELTHGDLRNADGGAGIGIWQAQGDSGVGVVRLGR